MRKSRSSEVQIVRILRESEAGGDRGVVRECSVIRNTFYRWQARFTDLEVSDLRRLKVLGEENLRLKNDGGWPSHGDRRDEVAGVE